MVRYVPSTPCHLPTHDSSLFVGLPEGEADGLPNGDADGEDLGLGDGVTGVPFFSGVQAPRAAMPINSKSPKPKSKNLTNDCLLIFFP
jgi:hypothetical protein